MIGTALAVWSMEVVGFLIAAPALMLILMLWKGERRWYWLAAGVAVLPVTVWFVVVRLLEHTLPG